MGCSSVVASTMKFLSKAAFTRFLIEVLLLTTRIFLRIMLVRTFSFFWWYSVGVYMSIKNVSRGKNEDFF